MNLDPYFSRQRKHGEFNQNNSNEKAFQLNANCLFAGKCLDYIMNKFGHALGMGGKGGPK